MTCSDRDVCTGDVCAVGDAPHPPPRGWLHTPGTVALGTSKSTSGSIINGIPWADRRRALTHVETLREMIPVPKPLLFFVEEILG